MMNLKLMLFTIKDIWRDPEYYSRLRLMSDDEKDAEIQRLREEVDLKRKEFDEMGEEELKDKGNRRRHKQFFLLQRELDKMEEKRQSQPGKLKPKPPK